ncbi:hypothetical protein F4781DRAFT_417457 [Annulohypoxylon bovei var. microspora]|nr:hypothetical protein F4781DRAFT_417457 [Annulohypoxylon bovei var. microspora]
MDEGGRTMPFENDKLSNFTPLSLCHRCQGWGQINIHNVTYGDIAKQSNDKSTTIYEYISVEQLAQHPHCATCTSIPNVYLSYV